MLSPAIALRSEATGSRDLPRRIKILDWGENKGRTTGAHVLVNERTLSALPANQQACACDTVELDYEHQSVKNHPNFKEDPRHSAAHGTIEVEQGRGVYLNVTDYTPSGETHAPNYKDVSAVVRTDRRTGELLLVSSVALTQRGDVSGMEFADHVTALAATRSIPPETSPNNHPQNTTMENNDKYRALLIKLLGLTPGDGESEISDESIIAAAESHATDQAALSAKITKLEKATKPAAADPAAEAPAPAAAAPEDDPVIALTARIDQMEKAAELREKQSLIARATAAGKAVPVADDELEHHTVAALSALIERLPAGEVPTAAAATREVPGAEAALSADDLAICKQLDLTEEEYKATLA